MQRTHPTQRASAPAHGFRPWEIADRLFQNLCDHLRRFAARLFNHCEIGLTLFLVTHFQLINRQTCRTQEPFDGLFWCGGRWALALFTHGFGFREEIINRQRQTARGRKGSGASVGQTSLDQSIGDHLAQIVSRFGLHTCGDFFREKFDQKIRH